jgi:hypothetical protein
MRTKRCENIVEAIVLVFLAIFALPFLGGYYMLDRNIETKVIGGILCAIGLVIWFLFGVH